MHDKLKVFIVSHTHWDREWYMSLQPSIYRYTKMMDRLLDILEKKPGYTSFHMDGQFLPVKDYLEVRPEKRETIRKLVSEGRLVLGPWYVPPTETFVSGESMIRNLMLGMKESEKLGGTSRICWIVDVLGHVSQMPMICRGFDINEYAAWRAMPKNSKKVFLWEGSDGSEVTVLYITGTYGRGYHLPDHMESSNEILDNTCFPVKGLRERMVELIETYEDRRTTNNELITNGADHSFAQSNLPEIIETLRREYPGMEFHHTTMREYIDAVLTAHKQNNIPFEKFRGEMFFEDESPVLEPINSVRIHLKVINAGIERLLERWTEPFSVYAHFLGAPYRSPEIAKAWELVLQNHSHDTLGCSSVDPVYNHTLTRYDWARDTANEVLTEELTLICHNAASHMQPGSHEMAAAVFNAVSFDRNGVIGAEIDIPKALDIRNPALFFKNSRIPMVIRGKRETISRRYHPANGFACYVPVDRYLILFESMQVPANGYAMLTIRDDGDRPFTVTGSMIRDHDTMENEALRVQINGNGTFDILHKASGTWYRRMNLFEDSSETGSGFARQTVSGEETIYSFGCNADIAIVEDCAFRAAFRIRLSLQVSAGIEHSGDRRTQETVTVLIESVVSISRGGLRVDVDTTITNRARNHRLRALFPANIDSRFVHVGQPFDVVKRDITPKDPNNYEPVPHQYPWTTHAQNGFVDFNDGTKGLTVGSDVLYEYEITGNEDKAIAITLIRSMNKLEFGGHAVNEEEYMELAQCIGTYTLRYSVIPHAGSYENAYRQWEDFKTPLRIFADRVPEEIVLSEYRDPLQEICLPDEMSFLKIEGDNVMVSAVKKQEERDSLIVRVHNYGGKESSVVIKPTIPGFTPKKAFETNLAERRLSECEMQDGSLTARIPPHGLVTVEFE
jgi:alpha-mannosidase